MHRTEVTLRTRLLGEAPKTVRPLSETRYASASTLLAWAESHCFERRAIENGANALAEGFLFGVAALLIIGETWRSSRSQTKRREGVDDRLDELRVQLDDLTQRVDTLASSTDERWEGERQRCAERLIRRSLLTCCARNDELTRILERIVEIGLRGGWAEFEGTPLALPQISLSPNKLSQSSSQTLPPLEAHNDTAVSNPTIEPSS